MTVGLGLVAAFVCDSANHSQIAFLRSKVQPVMKHEDGTDTTAPHLPPDLERTIFELAALSSPGTMTTLILVALRVKIWIELLLYRIVIVPSVVSCEDYDHYPLRIKKISVPAFRLNEPETNTIPTIFSNYPVRHLYIDARLQPLALQRILPACKRVTNLHVLFDATEHLAALGATF
ncbi:hypothetical protein B0H16DRAFT_727994 [Mycena metata]|uniref:Uncharacterized protein n=1 Tax=Mycena metata TaxID=1033252 RepID=A0AAD7K9C5_9AGAR|nr:hypothetical protein B0H16DRAFT_727994 [Mycena metata]